MNNRNGIVILNKDLNKEYKGCNPRLQNEFTDFEFTDISSGIEKEIEWLKGLQNEKKGC